MAKPILNLDSFVDRPTVLINGHEYWLVTPDILPPLAAHQLRRDSERADTLMAKDDLTDEETKELAGLPDTLCRMVLQADDAVHRSLDDARRALIVQTALTTFQNGLRLVTPATAAPENPAAQSSGESSSLG